MVWSVFTRRRQLLRPVARRPLRVEELESRYTPAVVVPQLSSLPGSSHTIYLDFDGNPAFTWSNGVNKSSAVPTTPPFDLGKDGDVNNFSNTEIDAIREIWGRVAEDYSPFDVNVTTVRPANFNHGSAIQVVIGGDGQWYQNGGYGGVSWVGAFKTGNSASTTAFVWPVNKGYDPGNIAKAASHEAGHTFGLQHKSGYDASGKNISEYIDPVNGFAPIMGGYGPTLSTFNTGPVGGQVLRDDAGNVVKTIPVTTQDDLAVLATVLGLKSDDYTAVTPLDVNGRTRSKSGIIETVTDTDTFSFTTTGGSVTARVTGGDLAGRVLGIGQAKGANLDAVLELLDSNGNVIATDNPSDSLDASITRTLAAGTYRLRVSTTGGPARGAVGTYKVSVDTPVTNGPRATASSPAGTVSASVSYVDVTFDQQMNTGSFSLAADVVSFTGPGGSQVGQITSFDWLNNTTLRIYCNTLTASGAYSLVIGPNITSAGGTAMDQNQNGTPGESTADRYTAAFTISAAAATGDRFEPNDSFAAAADFGRTSDRVEDDLSIHAANNDDYYKFTAGASGTATVTIRFANAQGNLDLRAYDANQALLGSSLTTGDTESVTFAVTAGASYYIRVSGAGGATNANYRLELDVPNFGDRFEGNDTPATATNLGSLGDLTLSGLSLHSSSDQDYFKFFADAGLLDARLFFRHAQGDIDFALYADPILGGGLMATSNGVTDGEHIVALLPISGTYTLRVYGQANPNYDLVIDGPGIFLDRFESNDTLATATNLGTTASVRLTNLAISTSNDIDYFKFVAPATGPLDISILRGTEDASFPPVLDVLNSAGGLIGSSGNNNYVQNVVLQAVAGQTYYVKAHGFGVTRAEPYTLLIGGTGVAPDRFAGNAGFGTATDLGSVSARVEDGLTLDRPKQNDYYRFVAAGTGTTTITVNAAQIDTGFSEGNDRRITIDVKVYDENRQLLRQSTMLGPITSVTLETTAGATYYVVAEGAIDADTVPLYSLSINGPAPVPQTVPPDTPPASPPPASPPGSPSVRVGYPQFAVGAGAGSGGQVRVFNADGSERTAVTPFPGVTGGVRTAAADFNGDGVADLVVGTGPGGPSHVRVLDGVDGHELSSIDPFEAAFTGGVFVAAGDLTGDGIADLVITPDEGGGPRVRVLRGGDFLQVADFFGIDDPDFRGGARAAVGDVNGDGVGDLLVAAGFGGGPRVAGFEGRSVSAGGQPVNLFPDFFAFETALRNGVYLAAGDLDGDGFAEVIAGGGPGGGPRVSAFGGQALVQQGQANRQADFFAGDSNNRGGVRVAVKNLDDDSMADIVTGSGSGAGSRVTGYAGKALAAGGTDPTFAFDSFPGFANGVFVG